MRFQSLALATLTLGLVVACGPRDRDCGPHGLIYVEGMGCVCPAGTRFVCDEGTTVCICEALDAGTADDASVDAQVDGSIRVDASSDAGCVGDGLMVCGTTCADTRVSAEHCGGCDAPCGAPDRCVAGECRDPVVSVEAGYTHSCTVHESGRVACWGGNLDGQLGDGSFTMRLSPVFVSGLDEIVQVEAHDSPFGGGAGYSCSRAISGRVSCWGHASLLGTGATTASNVPVESTLLDAVVDIAVGETHACAVRSDGSARCWGNNARGQLGIATSTTESATPVVVGSLIDAVQIVTSFTASCARLEDATVVCWGSGGYGELGDGTMPMTRYFPRPITLTDRVAELSATSQSFCARLESGEVACWGLGIALGVGITDSMETRSTPVRVPGISDAIAITGAGGNTCVLHVGGTVSCWGLDAEALGMGMMGTIVSMPRAVAGLADVVAVAAGSGHNCALTAAGPLLCWGANGIGQLGDGTTTPRFPPVRVADPR